LWTIINKEMHMHSLNVLYFFSVVGSLIFWHLLLYFFKLRT
jgi:hypothetical protein